MPTLTNLLALEILDSRGRPTLQVGCELAGGILAWAQVPSGASTGAAECHELRDGDTSRHGGKGCLRACASVTGEIRAALTGRSFEKQDDLDGALCALDGTAEKSRLGANAILGVSLAFSRAWARWHHVPLHEAFAQIAGLHPVHLPRPTINLFSGGKHAGGQVSIQDVLLLPIRAATLSDALADVCRVYESAKRIVETQYRSRPLVADEGGLAPDFPDSESMLKDALLAIGDAGFEPGRDFALAVDLASSHFADPSHYFLDGRRLSPAEMVELLDDWTRRYPIVSVEDGLAEHHGEFWPSLVNRIGARVLVLGDDFLCTNPGRIGRAIVDGAANALLLKVNQIGTVSQAALAGGLARQAGWHVTVSARSGETEDDWLADLAVGWQGDHIKIGSITRSERLAKYNRLLTLERQYGLPLAPPFRPEALQSRPIPSVKTPGTNKK
ncbi:MAG: phosphopyruvate hydratase [Verrucomicrobiales bacterium]|nr:phosphopyruvate hydratase [Verrucomicrobiales bacterium]